MCPRCYYTFNIKCRYSQHTLTHIPCVYVIQYSTICYSTINIVETFLLPIVFLHFIRPLLPYCNRHKSFWSSMKLSPLPAKAAHNLIQPFLFDLIRPKMDLDRTCIIPQQSDGREKRAQTYSNYLCGQVWNLEFFRLFDFRLFGRWRCCQCCWRADFSR